METSNRKSFTLNKRIEKLPAFCYAVYMSLIAAISLCFIPFISIFLIFLLIVPNLKIHNAFIASMLGLAVLVPATCIQFFSQNFFSSKQLTPSLLLVQTIVINGLIEESVKMGMISLIPWKNQKKNSFFICSLLCGLCLGSFESVIYLLTEIQKTSSPEKILHLLIIRMFTADIIHTLCAGLSGMFVFFRHEHHFIPAPFFFAIILHGLYNFFTKTGGPFYLFAFFTIFLAALECRKYYVTSITEKNAPNSLSSKKDDIIK